ncbi:hypothetical protein [Mycolicibacterium palauense]|uniref:hypothetical protein n=1 Tax=Mycolicibacterium palauense TaxID=2034511 RepID=UPI00159BA040|nr:hypothetical protein [Mycolicibacterium palauense]
MSAVTDRGPGVRVLSPVELGILTDLGYRVMPHSPTDAVALVGVLVFGRRRRAGAPGAA